MPLFKDPSEDNSNSSDLLIKVLTENLKQQKRAKRWKAIGRLFSLVLFVFIFYSITKVSSNAEIIKGDISKPHTALIEIKGIIAEEAFLGSSERVIESLRKAYEQPNVKGVILDLNSPGGSPVQSDLIYAEIKKLQEQDKNKRKVYAVVSDVCASGCYYLASAADQIYANELSTVGSIGVLFSSFGVPDLMKKIGVDRRLQTAGKYKAFLDPFSDETEEGKKIIQEHLEQIHDVFINKVTSGRKGKIKTNDPLVFSGLFWTGKQAADLGLIDDFKTKQQVAEEVIGTEDIIDYTAKPNINDILSGGFSKVSLQAQNSNLVQQLLTNNIVKQGFELK